MPRTQFCDFLSSSTAEGLRVTVETTVQLLEFIGPAGVRYLMTSNLKRDKLENISGIIRQSSGGNIYPTVAEFLMTINALAFYSLARPAK